MILSDNGIDHALLALGAMYVGVPVAPVSTAYSLVSRDFAKLRSVTEQLTPGLVFADDGARYAPALEAIKGRSELGRRGRGVAQSAGRHGRDLDRRAARDPAAPGARGRLPSRRPRHGGEDPVHLGLDRRAQGRRQHAAHAVLEPGGLRAGLAVPRRPAAGGAGLAAVEPHLRRQSAISTSCCSTAARSWIDDGKPAPGLIERTVANLRGVVADALFQRAARLRAAARSSRARPRSRAALLRRARSPAAMPARRCRRACGSGSRRWRWRRPGGSRPSSRPGAPPRPRPRRPIVHYPIERAGNIGLPLPGTEIKLVPEGDQLEIRVRGPNVTPGYWRRPDLTEAAFDEDGFYRPGRRGAARGPGRSVARPRLRRPHRREFQALDAAPGCRSARCASPRSPRRRR